MQHKQSSVMEKDWGRQEAVSQEGSERLLGEVASDSDV